MTSPERGVPLLASTTGHDAWVDGDEAYVGTDVSEQMKDCAKPK